MRAIKVIILAGRNLVRESTKKNKTKIGSKIAACLTLESNAYVCVQI